MRFLWNRLDLNGFISEGYSGMSTDIFPNDTIILYGGILNNFDPIFLEMTNWLENTSQNKGTNSNVLEIVKKVI